MISRIHDRLGTAGFVIAIIALVAALSGGAYAATGGLTGKQKKEVEKIAKKYAGKPGKPGTNGTNGTNGKDGTNGTNGKDGAQGIQGKQGDQGIQGIQGPPGEPGILHPGETLPAGATETGTWRFISNGESEQFVAISFPIPLSEEDAENITMKAFAKGAAPTSECAGSSEDPKAEPGVLCVYTATFATTFSGAPIAPYKPLKGAGEDEGLVPSGTYLYFENVSNGLTAGGTFAVTAALGS